MNIRFDVHALVALRTTHGRVAGRSAVAVLVEAGEWWQYSTSAWPWEIPPRAGDHVVVFGIEITVERVTWEPGLGLVVITGDGRPA